MFDKLSIIGCGLIGSSILRAIQEKKLATKISVYDKSNKVLEYLKKNFTADICSNVSETTKDADLVITGLRLKGELIPVAAKSIFITLINSIFTNTWS